MPSISNAQAFTIPAKYCCPISHLIMAEPVTASDGHVYEKEQIEELMSRSEKPVSPMTRDPLDKRFPLKIAHYVKNDIAEFIQAHVTELEPEDIYLPESWKLYLANAISNQDSQQFSQWLNKDNRLKHCGLIENKTALALALEQGSKVIIQQLIQILGVETIKRAITAGEPHNPFYLAWRHQNAQVIEDLTQTLSLSIAELKALALAKQPAKPAYLAEALISACQAGKLDKIDYWLTLGADINSLTSERQTALHLAVLAKQLELCRFLIAQDINVNAQDNKGNTALHLAAEQQWQPGCELLLQSGCQPELVNQQGQIALIYAMAPYQSELVRISNDLIKQTTAADKKVRQYAIENLGNLGQATPEVITVLVKALGDKDPLVRQRAAASLGQLGQATPEVIPALVKALGDEDSAVRERAAASLGQLGQATPEVITALVKALGDKDYDVREQAAASLVKLGQATAEVITALVKALGDEDSDVRQRAAASLGQLGQATPEVIPALVKALGDKDFYVRQRAAASLGRLGQATPEVIPALVKALGDEDSAVRQLAAASLGQLGQATPEVIPALVKALGDKDFYVRQRAAASLVKLGQATPEVIPALVKALGDKDSDVRQRAAASLGQLGQATPEVIPALVKALGDEDFYVRQLAAVSLKKIVKHQQVNFAPVDEHCLLNLLCRYQANWQNWCDEQKNSLLSKAIFNQHQGLVAWLLAKDVNLKTPDAQGNTALHHAVKLGHLGITRLLLERLTVSETNLANAAGDTAFLLAARQGDQALLEQLLEAGADPERKNQQGKAWQAVFKQHGHQALIAVIEAKIKAVNDSWIETIKQLKQQVAKLTERLDKRDQQVEQLQAVVQQLIEGIKQPAVTDNASQSYNPRLFSHGPNQAQAAQAESSSHESPGFKI